MEQVKELLFLHQSDEPCYLAALAESFGITVTVINDPSEIPEFANNHQALCLIPQKGMQLDQDGIPIEAHKLINELPIALYQAERNTISESAAILLGVQGLLYSDISMDLIMSSLTKLLKGELWFDRQSLSETVRMLIKSSDRIITFNQPNKHVPLPRNLTSREITIIKLAFNGARNKEIAEKLQISEHTVKAHISSIFRKTNSRNRVELMRWASVNLVKQMA
ncbi:response regulator transcription factor [Shewanella sp. 202IG2-18]|uniref:helix-turn-helix transcriptional regulator n=1 Tax=Parashewanella hymeniacidonis TaxID=2807618 RepID=UPI0019613492|nr:response regulator transcription factor [Parashewanella hymeniacidonis]MBM7071292.1 response regulator transcription factor [Parashewanella hymeniacidonis]